MGHWITLESGQKVYIGPKGDVEPSGPGSGSKSEATVAKARSAAQAHKEAERARQVVAATRARKPGNMPGAMEHRHPQVLEERGFEQGKKDVSDYVKGPKHTRHALVERAQRAQRMGDRTDSPWWQGYKAGAYRANDQWQTHMNRATGRVTRTQARLRAIAEKI